MQIRKIIENCFCSDIAVGQMAKSLITNSLGERFHQRQKTE